MPDVSPVAVPASADVVPDVAAVDSASKSADVKAPDAAKAADTAKTDAAAQKAEAARHKVKVNGEEKEVDLDELIRGYQLREASDAKFRTAAEKEKAAESRAGEVNRILTAMKDNPDEFVEGAMRLGVDPVKLAESILTKRVNAEMEAEEEAQMSPEQKERKALEKRIAEYEAKEAKAAEAQKKAEEAKQVEANKAATDAAADEYGQKLVEALELTKLPKNDQTALELLDLLEENVRRGLPVEPKYLAQDLERRKASEVNALRDPAMLDPEFRNAIRREAMNDPEIRELIRREMVAEFKANNTLIPDARQSNRSDRIVPKDAESPKKGKSFLQHQRELMLAGNK